VKEDTVKKDTWELVIDHRDHSVRRLTVPTGWIYQTQSGRAPHGEVEWGGLVFVPRGP
jgi:hypothetical protein